MKISFGSTYRIPITEAGINPTKKLRLREFISSFERSLVPSSNAGYCRVSILQKDDAKFEQKLRQIGYKVWQKFDAHDLSKYKIDEFIQTALIERNYKSVGKNYPKKRHKNNNN